MGQHPYFINLLRGTLSNRPPKPRYTHTWDLHRVTEHIKEMGPNDALSLKHLSWKPATLFAITCPERVSSIASLDLNHHRVLPEGVVFTLTVPTKGTRPDETVQAFFARYTTEANLCPVECFGHYLSKITHKREMLQGKPNNLFISYIRPYRPVSKATATRWILCLIKELNVKGLGN